MAFIHVSDVGLALPIYDLHSRSLKKRVLHMGRRSHIAESNNGVVVVQALRNLSFRLESGDRVGLIGRNGAGKSSLLRVLAGIYSPSAGTISREGKCVPLLDIALGMDDNSTGFQNIRLRGLFLGMSDVEIKAKAQEIADFTELADYLDLPLRTYSNGMRMRLAFAVSTSVDAQILLLDEVMGVGDAAFQEKARIRLHDLRARSQIVVIAMHSNDVLREICNKALWLERGEIKGFGPVEEVISAYEAAAP